MSRPSLACVDPALEPVSEPRPLRVFLLSPANTSAIRGQLLLKRNSGFELAHRFQRQGAPLGELFSFISSLCFRGKLAYAEVFANAPAGLPPALAMTTFPGTSDS
jgi:hypothetical protein